MAYLVCFKCLYPQLSGNRLREGNTDFIRAINYKLSLQLLGGILKSLRRT